MQSAIKKIPGGAPLYRRARTIFKAALPRAIQDYRNVHGRWPNLFRPKTFNEKIIYKRLFDRRDVIIMFADKLRVREYVRDRLGSDKQLIPLISVHTDPASIDLAKLPPQFVLKASHGCGWVRLYFRETPKLISEIHQLASSWLRVNYFDLFG